MLVLVIGQCNRTVKGTVNTSCAHAGVSHLNKLTVGVFFMKTYNCCQVSF